MRYYALRPITSGQEERFPREENASNQLKLDDVQWHCRTDERTDNVFSLGSNVGKKQTGGKRLNPPGDHLPRGSCPNLAAAPTAHVPAVTATKKEPLISLFFPPCRHCLIRLSKCLNVCLLALRTSTSPRLDGRNKFAPAETNGDRAGWSHKPTYAPSEWVLRGRSKANIQVDTHSPLTSTLKTKQMRQTEPTRSRSSNAVCNLSTAT